MEKNDPTFYFKKSLVFIIFVLAIIIATPAAKAAADLDIPLFVTDNAGGNKTLYFGLDGWGTDNLDPSIGEATYPPMPPKGIFDARFNLPSGADDSLKDYRHMSGYNYDVKAVYSIQFQPGSGKTITLKWNLPANTTGRLQDAVTGSLINVAMSGSGSYEVQKPDIFNKLVMTITYNFYNTPPVVPVLETGITTTTPIVVIPTVATTTPPVPVIPPTIATSTIQLPKTKNASLDIPLTIYDGGSRMQVLRFGLDASASDGLDNSLGEFTYPPMPPQGIFDARFNLPTGDDDSLADYRHLDDKVSGQKTYTIQYQPSEGRSTISLNWSLPPNITGKLQDVLGGQTINMPMGNAHSFTVLDPVKYNKLTMTINYSSLFASSTPITSPNPNLPPTVGSSTPIVVLPPIAPIHIIEQIKPTTATATSPVITISSKAMEQTQTAVSQLIIAPRAATQTIDAQTTTKASVAAPNTPQITTTQLASLSTQVRTTLATKYQQVYNKTPNTTKDWTDAALIVSGQAPQTKVAANEAVAKKIFVQVYKTQPNANSASDQKVIASLAYSLEPAKRSLPLEQKALTVYVSVYKHLPKSTPDWNIVKAVAYSGKVK